MTIHLGRTDVPLLTAPSIAGLGGAVGFLLLAGSLVSSFLAAEAIGEKGRADKEARKAIEQRDEARWNQYVSDMNLAQQAWEEAKLDRTLTLLENHRPKPEDKDNRGWEWHHLWRQCHLDVRTLQGHTDQVS